jgi:hypothetical protein
LKAGGTVCGQALVANPVARESAVAFPPATRYTESSLTKREVKNMAVTLEEFADGRPLQLIIRRKKAELGPWSRMCLEVIQSSGQLNRIVGAERI